MKARRERGSALILSVLMLALAQALLLAVTARAMLSAQGARRVEDRALALNAAEAGLAEACQRLRVDGWCGNLEDDVGSGHASVRVDPGTNLGPWRDFAVTSKGQCRSQHRALLLRVEVLFDDEGTPLAIRRVDWSPVNGP
jgi:hypothetical protein